MKKYILLFIAFIITSNVLLAQSPGDTIVIPTFNYSQTAGSGIRDTMIDFPNINGVTYEKIYMLYNMRCKNGLVSTQNQRNLGCGEWDYSCNTYITDSSKVDSVKATAPSHIIVGNTGTTYPYTTNPTYSYYQYTQKYSTHDSLINETIASLGLGAASKATPFQCASGMAKSQFVWKASELQAAGLSAGNISSIKLFINNVGSAAQFLRIKMKGIPDTVLNASNPNLTGFTEVYFQNTTLQAGLQEFVFYNNFNWNGTDNILIEFNFDNGAIGMDNLIACDSTIDIMGLVSEGIDYSVEFTGNNFMKLGNANFGNFTNQISISFWNFGNPLALPTNTSLLYASDASNNRQLNIHLPWSNLNIMWDCGSGGSYDRINKAATAPEFKGQWNYWVFTKNSTTGDMKIYLNGALWHSGTGKTIPIQITNLELGNQIGMINPYLGKLDEFALWNKELSLAEIQNYMHKKITATHPSYGNLMAYYKFNEGMGTQSTDAMANQLALFTNNPIWRKGSANNTFKDFETTSFRPKIDFVQGTYLQTTIDSIYKDSVINASNTVYSYTISNNAVVCYDTSIYYKAVYSYVYDGTTGAIIDSVANAAMNTINITTMNYYKIAASKFQIMSFVTPYGIGLDFGPNGKTWTFDVTDLSPILKGKKRMTMDAGGQRQEDMDIKFVFIVGTPPHDIKDISNIWQVNSASWSNILNENYFEPRSVPILSNASSFKVRTAITGHGQDGEFVPRTHYLDFSGGQHEFEWSVWKPCASNPVYPQGGTWIYDRAGWCPGAPTDLQEFDITPYVTPGNAATVDYGIVSVSGTSNYWVSNQLVSYGTPNFSLDARVVDIKAPTQKIEYLRTNSICQDPIVVIQNSGSTALQSLKIEYWINNNTQKDVYNWTGNLGFLETAEVVLPVSANLWSSISSTSNYFHVAVSSPNGGSDAYSFNNTAVSAITIPPVMPKDFVVYFRTNAAGSESSYKITDANGNVVLNRNNLANQTNYYDTMHLTQGCYQFIISDSDEDGFDFWANSDGIGLCRFKDPDVGTTITTFDGDFGKSLIYNFTVEYPLAYNPNKNTEPFNVSIYPNPTESKFTIKWEHYFIKKVLVLNSIGQTINMPVVSNNTSVSVDATGFAKGIYLLKITNDDNKEIIKKIIVE